MFLLVKIMCALFILCERFIITHKKLTINLTDFTSNITKCKKYVKFKKNSISEEHD